VLIKSLVVLLDDINVGLEAGTTLMMLILVSCIRRR